MTSHSDYPENATSTAAYWANKDRQMRAELAEDAAYAETVAALESKLFVLEGFIVRENMDPTRWATEHAALTAKLDAARARDADKAAAAHAAQDAEWTPAVTAERRAAWNAMIASGTCNLPNGKGISPAKVYQAERAQGWTMADLTRAIARHGL